MMLSHVKMSVEPRCEDDLLVSPESDNKYQLPPSIGDFGVQGLQSLAPSTADIRLPVAVPGGWSLSQPSIVSDGNGFVLVIGSVNLVTDTNGLRQVSDARGLQRHVNYWVELDQDLQLRAMRPIAERRLITNQGISFATGCCDLQIFRHRDQLAIAGRILDTSRFSVRDIAMGSVENGDISSTWVARFPVGYEAQSCRPVSDRAGEAITFLADSPPSRVLTLDEATRRFIATSRPRQASIARGFAGASPLVNWDDGFLGLVVDHATSSSVIEDLTYRFVAYDREFRLHSTTSAFRHGWMKHSAGIGLVHSDSRVFIIGVEDRQLCHAIILEKSELSELLTPLPAVEVTSASHRSARFRTGRGSAARDVEVKAPGLNPRPISSPHLTIAATIISGNNEDIIEGAMRTVLDWVDLFILIDTGIDDRTVEVAREIAGNMLVVRSFPWCDDFSAARNAALKFAHEAGADWSVTLDTDERINLRGVDIRTVLAETMEPVLLLPHDSREYTKDRFFRMPANGRFLGATHEAYYRYDAVGGGTVTVPHADFTELPKSPEKFQAKFERDAAILRREIEREPDQPRWHFYLGDALQRLKRYEEAVDAFNRCTSLRGWEEESAWAMFRAAECLVALDRLEEALDACTLGMARHSGLAEIPWYAGHISTRLNRPLQAVYWAHLAIATGKYSGLGKSVRRVGWSHPFGLWEGPYDVLRYAYDAMGENENAAEADRLFHLAAVARANEPVTN